MGRSSKPWLNYKSDAPEREYFTPPKTKRHFKWALLWLLLGAHIGAHRLYLWDYKKAGAIFAFYLLGSIALIQIFSESFEHGETTLKALVSVIPSLLIVAFELPKLKRRVEFKNKKHLIL